MVIKNFYNYLQNEVNVAPLIVFRILFAIIMLISLIRFISYNWIYELYIKPTYHFNFIGFEFVQYPGEFGIYLLFSILILSLIFILIGYFYHTAVSIFFIVFTYIELIDKSLYLNHYYFISILSFLMIFLPLSANFSIDSVKKKYQVNIVSNWQILVLKVLLSIVYFYAGIAKLNSDWLFNAMPLKLWLPSSSDLIIFGPILELELTAYIFSWFGAIYDLTIWIFLLWDRSRKYAYVFVIVFHVSTSILFQIGMFPYIMTLLTLIFFSESIHIKLLDKLKNLIRFNKNHSIKVLPKFYNTMILKLIILLFFIFQFIFPFRYLIYTNDIFWTEEGYRFSWRVMLMEKTGWVNYKIVDEKNNITRNIDPIYYLTDIQVKQMSFQPDMIIQFAKYIANEYKSETKIIPKIYVDSYVSLNGSGSKRYFKKNIDLNIIDYSDIDRYLEER